MPKELFVWMSDGKVSLGPRDDTPAGKRPTLWIRRADGTEHKLASFYSVEAAREYEAQLREWFTR